MELADGFFDIPPGKVATIVTHLEMCAPVPLRDCAFPQGLELCDVATPDPAWYRTLFRRVGAEDWLWFSRLRMSDAELSAIITDPDVRVATLRGPQGDVGLLELDFRQQGECELAFFGVARELIGQGAGRALMNAAVERAWAGGISRFHVHTCTLDSPQALPFYIRSGFVPLRQQVEIAPDPRLSGLISPDAAPQIPVFPPDLSKT